MHQPLNTTLPLSHAYHVPLPHVFCELGAQCLHNTGHVQYLPAAVHTYVCVYVCICVCMYVYVYVCTYVCMYVLADHEQV